jgi:hypothetical protein
MKSKMSKTEQNIKKIITNTTPIIDNIADIILGFAKTTRFEEGKTYWRSWSWDGTTTREEYKVERKTKCFVSVDSWGEWEIKRYKIQYDEEGNEYIYIDNDNSASLYSYDVIEK